MTESEFIAHEACDNCGSSDGNSAYSDGHKFCFVCQTYTPAEGEVHSHKMTTDVQYQGSAERLQKRNISQKTCQFFRIYRDAATLRFPYTTSDGVLSGFKIKNWSIPPVLLLKNLFTRGNIVFGLVPIPQ